jgi:adenine phosphoribosyltransferase
MARPYKPDLIVGLDARGFLFVTPVALALDAGAIMIRKKGKLPGKVSQQSYALEYGEATLALQHDRNIAGKTIVVIDDLLATGGTIAAANKLISQHGGKVAANIVLIELKELNGRDHLKGDVLAIQQYDY